MPIILMFYFHFFTSKKSKKKIAWKFKNCIALLLFLSVGAIWRPCMEASSACHRMQAYRIQHTSNLSRYADAGLGRSAQCYNVRPVYFQLNWNKFSNPSSSSFLFVAQIFFLVFFPNSFFKLSWFLHFLQINTNFELIQQWKNNSGESFDYFMDFFGKCFVRFFTNFGYDKMLKATGRYFCDFLQSVDNIHLQMRFTYPKMKSPSMQLTHVDEEGAILVYRSSRSGFSR